MYLEEEDIAGLDPLELRRRVAMVLQKPFMFEGSVLANLLLPFRYRQGVPLLLHQAHQLAEEPHRQ